MCGFIAQLESIASVFAEITGSNPVKALIFSGFFPIAEIGKLTAMITLHFHLQPQFKYKLFHIIILHTTTARAFYILGGGYIACRIADKC